MYTIEQEYEAMLRAEERENETLSMAEWMIDHKCTIRAVAKEFEIPRMTVYYRLTKLLKSLDYGKWKQCMRILEDHKKNRVEILQRGKKSRK